MMKVCFIPIMYGRGSHIVITSVIEKQGHGKAQWYMPEISVLRRLRLRIKTILSYIMRTCLKKKIEKKGHFSFLNLLQRTNRGSPEFVIK
jgi:hypothetical protein